MAYPSEEVVQTWLKALQGLNVHVKKMFGCYCLYCDDQPVCMAAPCGAGHGQPAQKGIGYV